MIADCDLAPNGVEYTSLFGFLVMGDGGCRDVR